MRFNGRPSLRGFFRLCKGCRSRLLKVWIFFKRIESGSIEIAVSCGGFVENWDFFRPALKILCL
jgi:hypothetical protein